MYIVLIVDNAAGHNNLEPETLNKLTNVIIVYIVPNCTTHLRPCDAGIIIFKCYYRKELCNYTLNLVENGLEKILPDHKKCM